MASSISILTGPQPLSVDEQCKDRVKELSDILSLACGQLGHMNPDWYAKFCDSSKHLLKFGRDNIHDETRRTLPKTNERDRRNQPLPANVIGRHFGTFTRHDQTRQ